MMESTFNSQKNTLSAKNVKKSPVPSPRLDNDINTRRMMKLLNEGLVLLSASDIDLLRSEVRSQRSRGQVR